MPPAVSEWSNLILRWIHVLAGIFWIGQTYYFTKLEGRMALDEGAAKAKVAATGTAKTATAKSPSTGTAKAKPAAAAPKSTN